MGLVAVVALVAGAGSVVWRPSRIERASSAAFEHVHGLGVNPADDAPYLAAHDGLYRLPRPWTRSGWPAGRPTTTTRSTSRWPAAGRPDVPRALSALALWTVAAAAVLITGCTARPPGTGAPSDDAGPELDPAVTLPLAVDGVVSCSAVSQQPVASPNGPRLASLDLPCLTAGVPVNPARLNGRPVVLNLWATWCQPCREEMPMLQATQSRRQGQVQFLGVNTKDRPDWAADFLQQIKVTYPEVVDTDGQLLAAVRSPGLPVTLVVDRDGRLVGQQIGRISQQRLDELIRQATA